MARSWQDAWKAYAKTGMDNYYGVTPAKPVTPTKAVTKTATPAAPIAPAQTQEESPYLSYLKKAESEAKAAQEARMNAQISQIAGQRTGINQSADEAARQAYINLQRQQYALPQQNAALGLSGGASESALLGLNTGYEESRNSIAQMRENALQENLNQQNSVRMAGDATMGDLSNSYAQQLANYYLQQEQYEQQRSDQLSDRAAKSTTQTTPKSRYTAAEWDRLIGMGLATKEQAAQDLGLNVPYTAGQAIRSAATQGTESQQVDYIYQLWKNGQITDEEYRNLMTTYQYPGK